MMLRMQLPKGTVPLDTAAVQYCYCTDTETLAIIERLGVTLGPVLPRLVDTTHPHQQ